MTLHAANPDQRKCPCCKRLCPTTHYHRGALDCKTCTYEKQRKSYLKKFKALKPMSPRRELSIQFNLRQSNIKIMNHLLDQVTSIGNHLQSLYAFKVNEYESRIVQLSVKPGLQSIKVYEAGSGLEYFHMTAATDDRLGYMESVIEYLSKNDIRLCLTELDLLNTVHALQNEW